MSDTDSTTDPTSGDPGAGQGDESTRTGDDLAGEVDRLRGELQKARKWEERAKANAKAAKDLDEIRRESEQAIEAASREARSEALAEAAVKIAAAELRAAAKGRMTADQLSTLLDGIDLGRFVTDGDVDTDAVAAFIDGIAPDAGPASDQPFDLGQGARGGQSHALNGDPLLRDLKSKLGIS